MKKLLIIFFATALGHAALAQNPTTISGAYSAKQGAVNHLILLVDGYLSYIKYENDKYLSTWGGTATISENGIEVLVEYNDQLPAETGSRKVMKGEVTDKKLSINSLIFNRQPTNSQDLDGLWRITGRSQEGKMSEINVGDRKTIKILVDGYFQWIAINPAQKGFYGTGGGFYTFKGNKYVEQILFFSRDNSRVGAKLSFQGEIKDKKWHHSGLSSKGDPIYEIWSLESSL